jgi:phage-related minor tail protein
MTGIPASSANSKAMIVGFALVATGGLIGLCGAGISGMAMVNAIRRWVRAQQEPPTAVVKRKMAQARAATAAGASAWQDGTTTPARH